MEFMAHQQFSFDCRITTIILLLPMHHLFKKIKYNSSTKPSGKLMEAMAAWQVIFPS
jgi:hypothetical protein